MPLERCLGKCTLLVKVCEKISFVGLIPHQDIGAQGTNIQPVNIPAAK
jgi:hypothetical protein